MTPAASLKTVVYDAVLDGIVKDAYKPGQILNEKQLVETFGVSKSPVREALIELCNEGVLKNIPRYGYEVVTLTRRDIENILQFRSFLEAGCLESCCERLTAAQLDELSELNDVCCNETTDDLWMHWERNKQFHLHLISYANNAYAYRELERSMDILKRAYAQFYWDKWNKSIVPTDVKSHKPLIQSLREKRFAEAVQWVRDDLKDFVY